MLRGTLLMLVMLTTCMVAKSVIIEWPFFKKQHRMGHALSVSWMVSGYLYDLKGRCRITLVIKFVWLVNYDVVDRLVIQVCLMNAGGGDAKGSQPSWM